MSIVVTGLNAALQKRFYTSSPLHAGNVHRADFIEYDIGGKGQNCANTLSLLVQKSKNPNHKIINLLQFVGKGGGGDKLLKMLERKLSNACFLTVRPDSELRLCTTVINEFNDATEFVDPSGAITEKEVDDLLDLLKTKSEVKGLIFMGSIPPGCPKDIYAKIIKAEIQKTQNEQKLLLIDSVVGLSESLQSISKCINIKAILKVNMAEIFRLVGLNKKKEIETSEGTELHDLVEAVQLFQDKFCISTNLALAITDGKSPAHFIHFCKSSESITKAFCFVIYRIEIVDLEQYGNLKTLYPIGAGDCVSAGTMAAWCSLRNSNENFLQNEYHERILDKMNDFFKGEFHDDVLISFLFGLACGSASCLQSENSVVEKRIVLDIFSRMKQPSLVYNS